MSGLRAFSYGGGVQSTACLVLAATGEIDYPLFVFANTGKDSENRDTLRYLVHHAWPYAQRNGVKLRICQRTHLRGVRRGQRRTLYSDMLTMSQRRAPIPVRLANGAPGNRACTEEFKIQVISRFLKARGASKESPATLGIGISLDELHRMRTDDPRYPHIHKKYPLIDLRLSRADCAAIIERAGLPLPPKSACSFCPFKRMRQWQELRWQQPDEFERAVQLERLLNERRAALGKDEVWLSRALKPLDKAVGSARQMDFADMDEGLCTTDYCMT